MERTFVMVKPDAVAAHKVGEILARFEMAGLLVVGMQSAQFDDDMVRKLYGQYAKEPFYRSNAEFITSGTSVMVLLEGENAIAKAREMLGKLGVPGTLRGDYGTANPRNAVHASDGPQAARLEIHRFFGCCQGQSTTG